MKIRFDDQHCTMDRINSIKEFQNQFLTNHFNHNYYRTKLIFFLACFQILFGLLMIALGTMSLNFLSNLLDVENNIWCGSLNLFIGVIVLFLFSQKCSLFGLITERTAIITSLLLNGLNVSFIHILFFIAIVNWNKTISEKNSSRVANGMTHIILMMMLFLDMILVTYLLYRFMRFFFQINGEDLKLKQHHSIVPVSIWNCRKPRPISSFQPVLFLPNNMIGTTSSIRTINNSNKSLSISSNMSSRKTIPKKVNFRYKNCKTKICNTSSIERKISRTKSKQYVNPERNLIKTYTGLDKKLANDFLEKCDLFRKQRTI